MTHFKELISLFSILKCSFFLESRFIDNLLLPLSIDRNMFHTFDFTRCLNRFEGKRTQKDALDLGQLKAVWSWIIYHESWIMRVLLVIIQIACLEGKISFHLGKFRFIGKNGILLLKKTHIFVNEPLIGGRPFYSKKIFLTKCHLFQKKF